MNISEICIRRPIFTWVLVLAPVALGIAAYLKLGVDLFPTFDVPWVTISAHVPGASAEEMESTVTKLIEEAVNSVSGLDELRSTTREGACTVTAKFVLAKNSDVAAEEVRNKVSAITMLLPSGMDPPQISRFDIDAMPIITIAVSGKRDTREITEIAKHQIQEQLQTIPGVGSVYMAGGRTRAIQIIINPNRLTAFGLSIEDVRAALVTQNLEVPGGILDQGQRELVLRTLGRMQNPSQFSELIVAQRNGYPVRIRDLGRAEDSVEEPRSLTRLDGQNAVSLFVQRQSGTNTIQISDAVRARLDKVAKGLPDDIQIEIIQDSSRFVRLSMEEVQLHLLLAGILVSLTILLFIQDWRTTIIAMLAIPTSIVPTFLFMWIMGFTLNNVTMLALILAIGIVIDDAVVVHENIFRHMEELGKDAMAAARDGTKEITLAVLATSLSLVVIFLPIAFMGGMVGRFFSSFGQTVACAIVMSLFVSLTLTPMLCSRFLKLNPSEAGRGHSKSGWVYRAVDGFYGIALRWAMRHRILMIGMCVLVVLSTIPIATMMGVNLVPRDDQAEFEVSFITPEGFSLERTDKVIAEIENRLITLPGVVHRFVVIGENTSTAGKGQGNVTRGTIYLRIKDLDERKYTQFDVMKMARTILRDFPDLRCAVSDVSAIGGSGQESRAFQVSILGPELDQLEKYSDDLQLALKHIPGLVDVDTTLSMRKPEVQVTIDRDRASDLGIPVETISNTLSLLIGGKIVSRYQEGTEQFDVWLRAEQSYRTNFQNLNRLSIPSPRQGLVQLSSLARPHESRGPGQIDRLSRQRCVTVLANPVEISLNDVMQQAQAIVKEMDLPPQYEVVFGGDAKALGETGYNSLIALVLSMVFMYLILAAQFESWLHPVSILAALPVTIPFGLLSLVLFRTPMDLYAMFGLFMLIGIVKKNGILQVDKTNELRQAGMEREEAILEANHTRLRPILMTTVMLIAAMVPIALGQGPGAGARASMAKVIIGGQLLSLLLALLVTPVTYSLFDSIGQWFTRYVNRLWLSPSNSFPSPSMASREDAENKV